MMNHPDLRRLVALIDDAGASLGAARRNGTLTDWLYRHWYLTPAEGFAPDAGNTPVATLDKALCAIVDGLAPWHGGWTVLETNSAGGCFVGKGNRRRWATPGRYASRDRPGLPPLPGDQISVPEIYAWRDAETGQWAAESPTPPEGALIRLYLNVGPGALGDALEQLLGWLLEESIGFRMKCPGDAADFARADSLVVYLSRDDWPQREAMVRGWSVAIAPLLRPGTPALTFPLANGMAIAEDPGDGSSFGQHRCAALACAVRQVGENMPVDCEQLEAALAAAGISTAEPWRCAP